MSDLRLIKKRRMDILSVDLSEATINSLMTGKSIDEYLWNSNCEITNQKRND